MSSQVEEPRLHDEGGESPLAPGAVSHGDDDEHVGIARVGDEDLGSVENIVFAPLIQDGHGLDAAGVGARAGLRQAEGAQPLPGAEPGKVFPLLGLGAEVVDGVDAEAGMGGEDDAGGAADLAQLLHRHDIAQVGSALAAVLLGNIHAHHAKLRHFPDGLLREPLLLVHVAGDGLYLILGKGLKHLLQQQFLFRQIEIHKQFPP